MYVVMIIVSVVTIKDFYFDCAICPKKFGNRCYVLKKSVTIRHFDEDSY